MNIRIGAARPVGHAFLRNHEFVFEYHADVRPATGKIAHGVLWEINDEQLAALDNREGFPWYYRRKTVTVEHNRRKYRALMYYMAEPGRPGLPSSNYLGMIERGYAFFGVPTKQISRALAMCHPT